MFESKALKGASVLQISSCCHSDASFKRCYSSQKAEVIMNSSKCRQDALLHYRTFLPTLVKHCFVTVNCQSKHAYDKRADNEKPALSPAFILMQVFC